MTKEKALESLKEVQNLLEGTIDTLDKAYQKAFLVVTRNRPTLDDLPDKHENWLDSPEIQVNIMSSKVRDHIHCAIDQVKKANSDLATAKTIYTLNAKVKKLKAEIETPNLESIDEENVPLTHIYDIFRHKTITPYYCPDIDPSDMECCIHFERISLY